MEYKTEGGYYSGQHSNRRQALRAEIKSETPPLLRKRTKSRRMTLEEMVKAAHMVFIDKESQAVVAKYFRRTLSAISALVCRLRRKPSLLRELTVLREEKS